MPRGYYTRTPRLLAERFHPKYKIDTSTGCWNWQGSLVSGGYGQIATGVPSRGGAKVRAAHIVSWLLHNGPIAGDLCVLHRCDNRACVNPAHLFLGSRTINGLDRDAKGRTAKGAALPQTKLSDDDVVAIRGASGTSQRALAARYRVSQGYISAIRSGRRPARMADPSVPA